MATNNNEKGKHPIEGFEHILTIDKLIDELNELKEHLEFGGNSLIYVAYTEGRHTNMRCANVLSGISSVCINGRTIQLNEEDFDIRDD